MPEGDTIHNLAARLRPALAGEVLERFVAPRLSGDRPRDGERIEAVEAVGKHLLIAFSGGLTLETHLQMTGRWDLQPAGDTWRRPAQLMRCYIGVFAWQAICYSAPTVRTFPTRRIGTGTDPLAALGPDLCVVHGDPQATIERCVRRMDALDPATEIAEALLDQRIANGVGNVYKSEICWHEQVHPLTPLSGLDEGERAALVRTAARLLQMNLGPGRRRTVARGLAVYGRAGEGCRRCNGRIVSATSGPNARVTYWCTSCQPVGSQRRR